MQVGFGPLDKHSDMYKAIVSLPSSTIATDIILLVSTISLLRDVGIDS